MMLPDTIARAKR